MKRALKRDANEPEIFSALRAMGATVFALHTPCDAIVGYRGRSYLVEVKTSKGKNTAHQIKFREEWRGQYQILRSVEQAVKWLNAVGKGDPSPFSQDAIEDDGFVTITPMEGNASA